MPEESFTIDHGDGRIVATAIHDGHQIRDDALAQVALEEQARLREEDPFTAGWTTIAPTRVVGLRSRFEVDLNRPRETAVYRTPEDAWGLKVWKDGAPSPELVAGSLACYDAFYSALERLYADLAEQHGRFVVFDLHSYNHRRGGPGSPEADPEKNPQVNVGTGTMADRAQWAPVIDRFISDLSLYAFPGGALDVRENVKFRGGNHGRWAHQTFPDAACVLSIEVKKFFMDEWSGEPDPRQLEAIPRALAATVPGVLEALSTL